MSENNKIGIEISSSYSGKGTEAARRDVKSLEEEIEKLHAKPSLTVAEVAQLQGLEEQKKTLGKLNDEFTRFTQVTDKVVRAQSMLDKGNDLLNRSLAAGLITQAEHDSILERLIGKYGAAARGVEQLGKASTVSAREMVILGRALATGNLEQAAQSSSIVAARVGGIGVAGIAAAAGVAAVVGGFALLIAEEERFERSLGRVNARIALTGREAGLTRAEIDALIKDIGKLPGMDRQGGADVVGTAAGIGGLTEDHFRRITQLANDLATATGTTAVQAVKELGTAASAGGKELLQLDERLNVLTLDQYESIKQFIRQGDQVRATEVFLAALEARIKGITSSAMTPLQQATDQLGNSWQGLKDKIGKSEGLQLASQMLENIVRSAAWMIENANKIPVVWAIGKMLPGGEEPDPAAAARAGRRARDAATAAGVDAQQKDWARGQQEQDKGLYDYMERVSKENAQKAKQEAEAIEKLARSYKDMADPIEPLRRQLDDLDKLLARGKITADQYAEATFLVQNKMEDLLGASKAAQRDTDERIKKENQEEEQLKRLERSYKDLIDPIEPLRRQLVELDKLFALGKLTLDEYAEATFNVQNKIEDLYNKPKKVSDEFAKLQFATEGWGRDNSRALAQMAVNGELSFDRLGDAAKRFVAELIEIQIQSQIMKPLLDNAMPFLKGLFAPTTAAAGGGGTGGAYDYGYDGITPQSHGGSGPGDMLPRRYVHPAIFDRAPRAHSGLGPNERPMVITRDESVLTPGQMRALGGTRNVRVEIVNEGAAKEVQSAEPRIDVDGMVVRVILRDQREGGPISRGFGNTFGLRRSAG